MFYFENYFSILEIQALGTDLYHTMIFTSVSSYAVYAAKGEYGSCCTRNAEVQAKVSSMSLLDKAMCRLMI